MRSEIPRITRCKLCEHWMHSDYYGADFCSLHGHEAGERDGCTWGSERAEDGGGRGTYRTIGGE